MASERHALVIVSDLHLSEGKDPATGKYSPLEDFRFDDIFAQFLSSQERWASDIGYPLRLIIAGDLVDFLQVLGHRKTPRLRNRLFTFGKRSPLRSHRLGRSTSALNTMWKLEKIVAGHKTFFQALAGFLSRGHELIVLPGNHDIEWVFPEVQDAFKRALGDHVAVNSAENIHGQVQFLPWFYLEPGLIYVEHGHQYCPVESFDYFLHPFLPGGLIDLPLGSFFVRYLFNHVESSWPFADNMKPPAAFIWWALKRTEAWRQMPKYIRFFLETLNKAGPLSGDWLEKQKATHGALLQDLSDKRELSLKTLKKLHMLWAPSAIHRRSTWGVLRQFSHVTAGSNDLSLEASCISKIMGVRYIVFGHTHDAEHQILLGTPPGAEYLNSGTWTKVFTPRSEERHFRKENEFVFVRVEPCKPKAELLRWDTRKKEGKAVRLYRRSGKG